MTSLNGKAVLLAFCEENSPVTGEFPSQRPVTRSFDVFFYLRLVKRLSKQTSDLRRHRAHYDIIIMIPSGNTDGYFGLYAMDSRYIAVKYNTILHTAQLRI